MGQSSCFGLGLRHSEVKVLKASISAACRKMTAAQVLSLADHLHQIIRERSIHPGPENVAVFDCDVERLRDLEVAS